MAGPKLFAIVLAAGSGSRFGGRKLLQLHAGVPLAARAARTAESVCGARSLLVTGSDWQTVFEACAPLSGFLVQNDAWRTGLGSSIAAGVRAVREAADAVLLVLADQPLVTSAHLESVIARWNGSQCRIVASGFSGVSGPPALFPAAYFGALAVLEGDRGARDVLAAAGQVEVVPFEPAAVDIDRPEDLAKLP